MILFLFLHQLKIENLNSLKHRNLEAQRVSLIHRLSKLGMNRLYHSESNNGGSIYQAVAQMVLSEEALIQSASDNLRGNKTYLLSWTSRLNILFYYLSFHLNMGFKRTEIDQLPLLDDSNFNSIIKRWEKSRAQLDEISDYPKMELSKAVLNHPILGFISFSQLMIVIEIQFLDQLKQINSLFEASSDLEDLFLAK